MRPAAAIALLLAAALLGGCSAGGDDGGDPTLTVYVSLPMRGALAADGRDAADGARLALADAGGEAAGTVVEGVYLDDTAGSGARARWSPVSAAANARRATQDATAIAYLGDFESGATRASLPVTNTAGLLQVSPASAAGDLVSPVAELRRCPRDPTEWQPHVRPGDPERPRPGRGRRRLGRRSGAAPGRDRVRRDTLRRRGRRRVRGGPRRGRGSPARPQLLYFGGEPANQPAALARTAPRLMVTDAELAPEVGESPGTLATSAALDPSQLPAAGQRFTAAFEDAYDRAPGRYAAYGYESMALILAAIEAASDATDRTAVAGAVFGLQRPDSILGPYEISARGETTLARMTGYEFGSSGRIRAGRQDRPLEQVGERRLELGEAEGVAEILGSARDHPVAAA